MPRGAELRFADIMACCRACVGRVCEGEVDMSDVS